MLTRSIVTDQRDARLGYVEDRQAMCRPQSSPRRKTATLAFRVEAYDTAPRSRVDDRLSEGKRPCPDVADLTATRVAIG
jgi:hypothetical protein